MTLNSRRLIVVAVFSCVLALLVAAVHTPPVRSAVLRWAFERLQRSTDVRATASRFDYNLLTLDFSATNITLTSEGAAVPFFSADSVRVDLPWTVLGGPVAFQSLELNQPSLTLVRRPDGTLNLPVDSGDDAETMPGPIEIARLDARNLSVRYDDRLQNILIEGRNIDIALEPVVGAPPRGRLTARSGIAIHVGEHETRLSRLNGRLRFDGYVLSLEHMVVEAPEGRARLDGDLRLLPAVELSNARYEGQVDLARVTPWIDLEPAPTGTLAFSGTAAGPIDGVTLKIDLAGDGLRWSALDGISVRADGRFSDSTIIVDSLAAMVAGGEIVASARLPLDEDASHNVHAEWRNVALDPIVSVLPVDVRARLAAAAEGSATLEWTGGTMLGGSGTIENVLRARARRGALPISGRAVLLLDEGQWQLSHDHSVDEAVALSGRADGRIHPDALTSSTLRGRAKIRIANLARSLRLADSSGLVETSDALAGFQGRISASANLSGTIAEPYVTGAFEAAGLSYGETGPGEASARFSANPHRLVLDPLQVSVASNTIAGRTTINFDSGTIRGELSGDLAQLFEVTAELPAEWRPQGSASIQARIAGTLDNPTVAAELASDNLEIAGQSLQRLRSNMSLVNRTIAVDVLDVGLGEGQLAANGSYHLPSGRFSADVSGTRLTIAASDSAKLPLDAQFDVELSGSGTIEAPDAQGFVDFSRLSWEGYEIGPARVDIDAEGETLELKGRAPDLAASLHARVALEEPRSFAADISIDEGSLSRLIRHTESPELAGTLSMRVHATGTLENISNTAAEIDLRMSDASINGIPVRLVRPAHLQYSADAIVVDNLELRIGGAVFTAEGRLTPAPRDEEALRVSLVGSLTDVVPLIRMVPDLEVIDASGAMNLLARVTGSFHAPEIQANLILTDGSFSAAAIPPIADVDLRASYESGIIHVQNLRALWQGARISATGQVPAALFADPLPDWYERTLPATDERARAILRAESITASTLSAFLDEGLPTEVAGRIDMVAAITAASRDLERIEADVTLERAEFSLAGVPLNQVRPTRLRMANRRLQVVDWTWAGAGNRIEVSGGALLTGESPELDLALDGTLDLRMLGAFSADLSTSGRAALDVHVTGLADQPLIDGQLSVDNGALIVRDPRFAISDLQGTVTFARDELQLGTVTANANGGTLRVTGNIRYPRLELTGGTVAITGRGLAFELPEDLRTEVNADLQLNFSARKPTLSGTIILLRGSYREPVSLAAQLLTGVETQTVAQSVDAAGLAERIALDVAVRTANDLVVDNNYARLEVAGDLRLVGTLADPIPTGRMTIREGGDVFLGGRTYEVARGTVDFTSAIRIEPNIDLALDTRVQRYDITLEVTGTPENIEANLRSSGLSQADVVSLLLTGQLAESGAIVESDVARGQLLMLLSGELLGFAGRAVGLDRVQIGRGLGGAASDFDLLATDIDPSARLTITKNLSRDVELVFSQSLRDTGDTTWIAIYRPVQNIEVRGASQDDGSRSAEFRHEVSFGGTAADKLPQSERAERPVEEVTAVRIAGNPGLTEDEIRGALRLEDGDRFDFYRWQQDRDRLQRLYRDRGFLEARISARRTTSGLTENGRDGLALEYEIDQGPETRLTVQGHSLPDEVVERMKDAWMWTVYDGFLLDELVELATEHLTNEGYLRAEAQAQVVSEPDEMVKKIVVRINPGGQFSEREIAFSGQRRVSVETLTKVVHEQNADALMWHEPAVLETALEDFYRSHGYLETEVDVQPLVFSGQSATLPVRINEGRLFTVASVKFNGARAFPAATVRDTFGIIDEAVYRREGLEPARRAVELEYLREGYNDVRVSTTALVNEKRAVVDVVLNIEEGPQQVLADITISGAEITQPDVIDRALDIELGQPANLSELYRAEKRLYDTGAFRTADVALVPFDTSGSVSIERVRAEVTLQELSPYRFRYGFRVNDSITPSEADRDVRPALVVDLLRRNLFGRAIAVGGAAQVEFDRRLARGIVALPRFFGLPVATNLFVTASHEDFTPEGATSFVEDQSGITAEQRFAVSPRMQVTYGYNYSHTHVFEPEPEPGIPPLDLRARVAGLTGTYAWDRRDDPFSPQDGWFHSSGFEIGARSIGSDLRFIRYLTQQQFYRRLRGDVVTASAFRLGLGRGFDQDLIPSEKFFAGGGTSVRGFAEDALGAVDFFGDPTGGNGMVILNQEVRFPLYRWVRGVGFIDAGNVFSRAADVSLINLDVGAGAGVRIHSPFVLVRVDFGVPLTNRARQRSGRWYFGIGQSF